MFDFHTYTLFRMQILLQEGTLCGNFIQAKLELFN